MPRMEALILEGLGDDGLIWLKMPPPTCSSGQSLAFCRRVIENILSRGPHVYKIGVTANPLYRFYKRPTLDSPSPGYYYSREKYKTMYIIYSAATFGEAALMEAVLIEGHRNMPGCRNENPGGEGRKADQGPFFTYVVFKSAMY